MSPSPHVGDFSQLHNIKTCHNGCEGWKEFSAIIFIFHVASNICNVFAAVLRPVSLATLPLDASAVWGPSFFLFVVLNKRRAKFAIFHCFMCICEQSCQWMLRSPHRVYLWAESPVHVAVSTPCVSVSRVASACFGFHTVCICEHQFVTKVSPLSFSISAKWDKSVIFVWRSSQQIHTVQYCRLLDITRDISVISNIVHHVITRGGILDLLWGKFRQKLL